MSASTDSNDATDEAGRAGTAGAAAQANQFVTFSVAGEMFAVPMAPVQEIIRVPEVARLPLAPPALDGLSNLRGRVLPIVNLRRLFGCEERALDDATRALVINLGQPLGFIVDRVSSVISAEPSQIEASTTIQSVVSTDYLTGVIKRTDSEGKAQLLLTLDFGQLIDKQFNQVRKGRPATGQSSSSGTAPDSSRAEVAAASDELRLVSFAVAAQEYAIDIAAVQEIVQVPERITALPNTQSHVLGVISLRQRLLPLVSLRSVFGLSAVALNEHHRIVVVALPGGSQVGLVTDSVKEVLSVPRAQTEPMPGVLAQSQQLQEFASICRLDDGKRLVSIIDTEKLLHMQAVRDAVQAANGGASGAGATEQAMSTQSTAVATDDDDAQVVIFRLGAEEFGVPIMSVQEIVRVPEQLTKVPRTPRFVEGMINLRGTVLPVIDQRSRLGLETIARNDRQRIMVYMLSGLRTGFIVDSVAEVLRIPRSQIDPAPALSDEQGSLISRVAKLDGDKRLVMLIDPSQLLGAREVSAMQGMQGMVDTGAPQVEVAADVTIDAPVSIPHAA